ncbi:MAG: type I restriction enzyme HsdR N-terminal domain-containing protein, partial [Myxococcota bacterium]
MTNDHGQSIFQQNIRRGLNSEKISFDADGSRVTYHVASPYSTRYNNPEEKVRAAYFAELLLDYKYCAKKIRFEVPVPKRTPADKADMIVYEDDACKRPFIVVECKRDGITDAEFQQAVEQLFGNANSVKAPYGIVVAGTTRRA